MPLISVVNKQISDNLNVRFRFEIDHQVQQKSMMDSHKRPTTGSLTSNASSRLSRDGKIQKPSVKKVSENALRGHQPLLRSQSPVRQVLTPNISFEIEERQQQQAGRHDHIVDLRSPSPDVEEIAWKQLVEPTTSSCSYPSPVVLEKVTASQGHKTDLQLGFTLASSSSQPDILPQDTKPPALACQFLKYDPIKHEKCRKYRFHTMKEVKQHLRRGHLLHDLCCPRCQAEFHSKEKLREHQRDSKACEVSTRKTYEISDDQRRDLQSYPHRNMNTEQQWGFVWCTLFPGVPHPDSIYVEDEFQEALVAVRKVWEQKKEDIIPDVISRVPMGGRDEDAVQQMQSILRGLVEDVFDRVEMELLVAKASNSSSNNSSQNNPMSAVSISAAGYQKARQQVPKAYRLWNKIFSTHRSHRIHCPRKSWRMRLLVTSGNHGPVALRRLWCIFNELVEAKGSQMLF